MLRSLRVRERLYRWVLWLVALLFAGFLTGLGGLVIGDLPRVERDLALEQFVDAGASAPLDERLAALRAEAAALADRRETADLALTAGRNAYRSAREGFANWVATRGATGQAAQDDEVLARTRELDALKATERARQAEVESIDARALQVRQATSETQRQRGELQRAASERLGKARFAQELRVFGFRLALTLPLLAVAGWLFARHRNGTWWPFVWGFAIFALLAFFVELVPYLPSYGGYVRHVVGIGLTAIAGIYLIRATQRYLATKQAEQQRPQDARRGGIRYEQALGQMGKGVCPACERSTRLGGQADPDYCMHCGLQLSGRCPACDTRRNAFFQFCPACGARGDAAST